MRAFAAISLLIGLVVTGWLTASLLGGGGSGPVAPGTDGAGGPTAALQQAQGAQSAVALKQAEMQLQACAAQQDGTFAGCRVDAASGVQVVSLSPGGYQLRAGSLLASYDSGRGASCHSSTDAPRDCAAW